LFGLQSLLIWAFSPSLSVVAQGDDDVQAFDFEDDALQASLDKNKTTSPQLDKLDGNASGTIPVCHHTPVTGKYSPENNSFFLICEVSGRLCQLFRICLTIYTCPRIHIRRLAGLDNSQIDFNADDNSDTYTIYVWRKKPQVTPKTIALVLLVTTAVNFGLAAFFGIHFNQGLCGDEYTTECPTIPWGRTTKGTPNFLEGATKTAGLSVALTVTMLFVRSVSRFNIPDATDSQS